MGWFTNTHWINENLTLIEGADIVWQYNFRQSTTVRLDVQRLDGYGPDVYVVTEDEYRNYKAGKMFKYITQLSYENIEYFSNTTTLPMGRYRLIARLNKVADGWRSYSEFGMRFEAVQ